MAQPSTAKFGKMRVLLGAYPTLTVAVTSVSNANPTKCTVAAGDITKFKNGKSVIIAGVTGTGMTSANGTWTIADVGVPANQFTLVGSNTAAGAAPATTGITAKVKDEAGTITYIAPCGMTTKNVTLAKNLNEIAIPDCTDPDAPLWMARDVGSMTCTISGDGFAAAESVPDWDIAAMSTDSVPMKCEILFDAGTVSGTKTITGRFHVDSEAFSAEAGNRVQLAINAQSDGPVTAVWA